VDHRSFLLDLRILALTLLRVFQARGINQPGQATMKRFTGSSDA
jgi:sugar transferase EpsL